MVGWGKRSNKTKAPYPHHPGMPQKKESMTTSLQELRESLHVQGYIEDPIAYFKDILHLPEVYGVHARIYQKKFTFYVALARANQLVEFDAPYAAGEDFFFYIEKDLERIERENDVSISVHGIEGISTIRIIKNARMSFAPMIEAGGTTKEVCDFISQAYRKGVSIAISGVTGAGKTRFLNTLIEANQDGKETVIVSSMKEMIFNDESRRQVEIIGDTGNLLEGAVAIGHNRIIIDEYYPGEDALNKLFTEHLEKQFIYTTHHSPIPKATGEEEDTTVFRIRGDHNFQLRVDLEMIRIEELERKNIPTIAAVHEIVNIDGKYSLRTLFSKNEFAQEPMPLLARIMGLTQKV